MQRKAFLIILLFTIQMLARDHLHYQYCFVGKRKAKSICFINIPKNCSSYLRDRLFKNCHMNYSKYESIEEKSKPFFKIICVRDPLYRPIASYNEVLKLRKDGEGGFRKTVHMEFWKQRKDVCLSFKTFLTEIEDNFYDPHISYQYNALERIGLTLEDVDFVFLKEEIEQDIAAFEEKYGKSKPCPIRNSTPLHTKKILKAYIDNHPDIQAQIRKLWAKDFEFYEAAKKRRLEILDNF